MTKLPSLETIIRRLLSAVSALTMTNCGFSCDSGECEQVAELPRENRVILGGAEEALEKAALFPSVQSACQAFCEARLPEYTANDEEQTGPLGTLCQGVSVGIVRCHIMRPTGPYTSSSIAVVEHVTEEVTPFLVKAADSSLAGDEECRQTCQELPFYQEQREAENLKSRCRLDGIKDAICEYYDDSYCGASGRAPAGLRRPQVILSRRDGPGAFWARMAHLEAASVIAFERLADELAHHHAPDDLVQRSWAAAEDEVRHARVCRAMAARHGVQVEPPVVDVVAPRSLREVALENTREGCVLEAFAALQARWQSERATDPTTAGILARISHDETRHGQLAWDIDAWAHEQLGPALAAELAAERSGALEGLAATIERAGYLSSLTAVGLDDLTALADLARRFALACRDGVHQAA